MEVPVTTEDTASSKEKRKKKKDKVEDTEEKATKKDEEPENKEEKKSESPRKSKKNEESSNREEKTPNVEDKDDLVKEHKKKKSKKKTESDHTEEREANTEEKEGKKEEDGKKDEDTESNHKAAVDNQDEAHVVKNEDEEVNNADLETNGELVKKRSGLQPSRTSLIWESSDDDDDSPKKKRHGEDKHLSRAKTGSTRHILTHKRNVLGEIIYKGHPSWVLMQNIQTGIRHYVGRSSEVLPETELKKLSDFSKSTAFFASPDVLRFPAEGSKETLPHKTGLFKFKDYCPLVFRHLRQKFHIDPADYMVSLCNTLEDGTNALRELPTPGKSGSLFFFSHDMKYILKTIPKREAKLLRFLLPAYYKHVMDPVNTDTLLPKFFGLHRVKPHKGRQVRFVVMGNIFATNKKIHERFDLKGSTLGRQASAEEKAELKEYCVYKDLDWRSKQKKLQMGPHLKQLFLDQLKKDCSLLEKLNVMDYSLLIGIHHCDVNDGMDCSPACLQADLKDKKRKMEEQQKKDEKKKSNTEKPKHRKPRSPKQKKEPTKDSQDKDTATQDTKDTAAKDTQQDKPKDSSEQKGNKKPEDNKEQPQKESSNNHTDTTSTATTTATATAVTISTQVTVDTAANTTTSTTTTTATTAATATNHSDNNNHVSDAKKDEKTPTTKKKKLVISLDSEPKERETTTTSGPVSQSVPVTRKDRDVTRKMSSTSPDTLMSKITSLSEIFSSSNGKPKENEPKTQTSYYLPDKLVEGHSVFQADDGGMRGVSDSGERLHEYYYVGIIDILMLYTIRKRAEHVYKTVRFADTKDAASSVDPVTYSKRFQSFISEITE